MQAEPNADFSPPFEIIEPAHWRAPLIFNSPHSGRTYPKSFLRQSRLSLAQLRKSEDFLIDQLIEPLTAAGFGVVRVHFPRCYVDVNREPYELDPRMFHGRLPSFVNTHSMRVAGGLGTVARIAGDAQDIYARPFAASEALSRIETLYKPYHRALRRLINKVHQQFGRAMLIDCHSMPSRRLGPDSRPRPDFIIGDRYGNSCAGAMPSLIENMVGDFGYSCVRNKPYAGGFITEHYGNPLAGFHAIQIEMNRAIYMDETDCSLCDRFAVLRAQIGEIAEGLSRIAPHQLMAMQSAAE